MRSQVKGRFYPIADYDLELFLCGELDPALAEGLEQRMAGDPALAAYVRERRADQRTFATRHPPRLDMREQRKLAWPLGRAHRWRPRRQIQLALLGLCASAAALLLVRRLSPELVSQSTAYEQTTASRVRDVRVKGSGLHVSLYVKRGDRVFAPEPRAPLRAGDRVRIAIDDGGGGYLTVLARDSRDKISTYYDRLRAPPGRFVVPDSLEMDERGGSEQWLVLVADEPRSAAEYSEDWKRRIFPRRHALLEVRWEP